MSPRRWRFGHLQALLEGVCAVVVVVVVVLISMGSDAVFDAPDDRSIAARMFPLVLAALLGGGLAVMAVRSWRAADEPAGRVPPLPSAPTAASSSAFPVRAPELSDDEREQVGTILSALLSAGVLAPEVPTIEQLHDAVADQGPPYTADVLLTAIVEAGHYHSSLEIDRFDANLAFHDSHVEQDIETLHGQVEDILRLCGATGEHVSVHFELGDDGVPGIVSTIIRVTTGGVEQVHAYPGAGKYLSTHLHVALARTLRARSRRRLAWLWTDQGVWLSGLNPGMVEQLNGLLESPGGGRWEWVDEQDPIAAGLPDPSL